MRSSGRSPEESLWDDQHGAEVLSDPNNAAGHSATGFAVTQAQLQGGMGCSAGQQAVAFKAEKFWKGRTIFQTIRRSSEEETLSHIYLLSVHVMYISIGIPVSKHSTRVFRKIAGTHVCGHARTHPDRSLCTFVFIEWA